MARAAEAIPSVDRTRPKIVFFYSNRSGPCRRAEGFVAQVLQRRRNHGTFDLYKVEVEERPDLAERFEIDRVPTLLVLAGRRVQGRLTRPRGCRDIADLLEPWLR